MRVATCKKCGTHYHEDENECPKCDYKECCRCGEKDSKQFMTWKHDEWYCDTCFEHMFVSWNDVYKEKAI